MASSLGNIKKQMSDTVETLAKTGNEIAVSSKKDTQIVIRCSKQDRNKIKGFTGSHGVNMSDFIMQSIAEIMSGIEKNEYEIVLGKIVKKGK